MSSRLMNADYSGHRAIQMTGRSKVTANLLYASVSGFFRLEDFDTHHD
jgi:hypothetical protein